MAHGAFNDTIVKWMTGKQTFEGVDETEVF